MNFVKLLKRLKDVLFNQCVYVEQSMKMTNVDRVYYLYKAHVFCVSERGGKSLGASEIFISNFYLR